LEGKWFAESAADAEAWGHLLCMHDPFHVILVQVDAAVAATLFRLDRLDNIGPARFAATDELAFFAFVGVVR
jgi:hypothetical protein